MGTFQIPPTTFTEFKKTSKQACSSIALSCTREIYLKVNLHYYASFKYVIEALFKKGQPGPTICRIVATDSTSLSPREIKFFKKLVCFEKELDLATQNSNVQIGLSEWIV